jgi:hypothetical protein
MPKTLLTLFLAALLAACGTGDETAATAEPEKVVHVYNWADYVAESTIQAGALRKLDKSKLGNLGNLDPQIMQLVQANDPAISTCLPPSAQPYTGRQYSQASGLVTTRRPPRDLNAAAAILPPALLPQYRTIARAWTRRSSSARTTGCPARGRSCRSG